MGDEDNPGSLVGKTPQDLEEIVSLLRRQDRGRLIQDHHPSATVERLDDLNALLLPDR